MSDFISSGLNKKIDHLMDICFGAGMPSHQTIIEQLNYLFFLRALSKKDEEAELLGVEDEKIFVCELAQYSWQKLLSHNAEDLFDELENAYKLLPTHSTNKTVRLVFKDAHVKIYARATLRQLLHEIDRLEALLDSLAHKGQHDVFGDMYEYLLSKMAAAGSVGMFRTPRHIVKFMVDVIGPEKGQHILDPACGTAGFLVAAYTHLGQKYTSPELYKDSGRYSFDLVSESERQFIQNKAFHGFDSGEEIIKFGLMNALLHDLHGVQLKRQNTLVDTTGDRTKYDVILANPPFAGKIDKNSVSEDIAMGTGATEILFLRYMLDHLTEKGKMAVIVPEGVIFSGSGAHVAIRKMLVEQGLFAVVSLPSGVFNPYAGVKTSILFVDRSLKSDKILFVKVQNDGFSLGAQRNPIDKNDLPEALAILAKWKTGKKVEDDMALYVEKSKIAESGDYNLSGDRYRVTTDYSNTKWPIVALGELEKDNKIKFLRGLGLSKSDISEYGKSKCIHYGEIYTIYDPIIKNVISKTDIAGKVLSEKGDVLVPATTTADALGISVARSLNENDVVIGGDINIIRTNNEYVLSDYLAYLISYPPLKIRLSTFAKGVNILHLSNSDLRQLQIPLPTLEIQEQIVAELDGYANIIAGAKQITQNWKPQIPIDPEWPKVRLDEIVDYEQPTKYIVSSVVYSNDYKIPVLTAGKSFILGYTDEKVGVYCDELPVIIFDDFTTASKLVDFRFKVKSSAMKILHSKNKIANITFVYTMMQHIKFNSSTHKRYWISEYSKLSIPLPDIETQNQIVEKMEAERALVESAQKLIDIYEQKTKDVIAKLLG